MTIRKIENARQEECDYINYTIFVFDYCVVEKYFEYT